MLGWVTVNKITIRSSQWQLQKVLVQGRGKTASNSNIIANHNIQKTHIHTFHNKLLGEVAMIVDVVSDFDVLMRAKVILAKNLITNTSIK